jgi:hypothetical protein
MSTDRIPEDIMATATAILASEFGRGGPFAGAIDRVAKALVDERNGKWEDVETAPRDGKDFLAVVASRPAFGSYQEHLDIARWVNGHSEQSGHFRSRTGGIVVKWCALPRLSEKDQ